MTQLLLPKNDNRKYKLKYLENGLKCMLVSDMKSTKAATGLRVNVGSHANSLCGLPHFLEHMLFYGSKKYPQENYYSEYITQHGGSTNAFTASDNTTYFFSICSDFYEHAVDVFSHFFIDPVFNEEMLSREINAIDAEFYRSYNNDTNKLWQVLYDIMDAEYPIARFSCGNKQTLNDPNLYKMMTEFYETYYCANIMSLVMIAPYSIEYLDELVTKCFSEIKAGLLCDNSNILNNNILNNNIEHLPTGSLTLNRINMPYDKFLENYVGLNVPYIEMVPNNHANKMTLVWQLPKTEKTHELKLSDFWSNIIGHEGPNSLLSFLKSKSLVLSLSSACYHQCNFDLFMVSMLLTDNGNKQPEYIVNAVMEYINGISDESNENILNAYHEDRQIGNINFDHKTHEKPSKYILTLLENMYKYTDPYILFAENYYTLPTPELYEYLKFFINLLRYTRPLTIHHNVNAHEFNNTEKYYNTPYNLGHLCLDNFYGQNLIKYVFPEKNKYIPENFDIVIGTMTKPEKVVASKNGELWHRTNTEFNVPKVEIAFQLILPEIWKSPQYQIMCALYINILLELVNEKLYSATLTGINYNVSILQNCGITFNIRGYNDKISLVCMEIINEFTNLNCDDRIFNMIVEKAKIKAKKAESLNTQEQLYQHFYEHNVNNVIHYTEILSILNVVSLDKILQLRQTFANHYWIGMIEGNFSIEQSIRLFYDVTTAIKNWKPYTGHPKYLKINTTETTETTETIEMTQTTEIIQTTIIKNASNDTYIYNYIPYNHKEIETNSSTMKIYAIGNLRTDYKRQILLDIFSKIIGDSFFNQLRTQQQLGYCVGCNCTNYGLFEDHMYLFYFTIQSSEYDNEYLQTQIDKYIENIYDNLNEQSFSDILKSVISGLKQPFNSLTQSFGDFTCTVLNNTFDFSHKQNKINVAELLTFRDLQQFVKEIIVDNRNNYVINVN